MATLEPYKAVGITFAPDGRIFAWEKDGVIRTIRNGIATPFLDIRGRVNTCEDRGLLGFALDPNFSSNGYAYLLYAVAGAGGVNDCGPGTSRVTRFQANPANPDVALSDETIILSGIATAAASHSVGSLRFGPDGKLFISHGDGAEYAYADPYSLRAQSLDYYTGKILRINTDGTAPADNPYYDGTDSVRSKVWAYGLRNPFRFDILPTTGEPIIGDVGWNNWEEIDTGRGANFGWPCYEGNLPNQPFQVAYEQCRQLPPTAVKGPLHTYPHDGGNAVVGGPILTGTAYPEQYRNNYFYVDYVNGTMRRIVLNSDATMRSIHDFGNCAGGPVQLTLGPDGMLYCVAILSGQITRLRHTSTPTTTQPASTTTIGTGNNAPVPVISSLVTGSVTPGQTVTLNGSATDNEDGQIPSAGLTWTVLLHHNDHVHPYLTITGSTGTFTIPNHGIGTFRYEVQLKATDSQGLTATTTSDLTVTETNQPDHRLYPLSVVPPSTVALGSTYPITTGQRFSFGCGGTVAGVWWYRTSSDTGLITVAAWRDAVEIARSASTSASFGWAYLPFSAPATVSAGDTITLAVHHPNGAYGYRPGGFDGRSIESASGCVRSPASTPGAPNGLYVYGAVAARPTLSYEASEYFLEPEFAADLTPSTTAATTTAAPTSTTAPPTGSQVGYFELEDTPNNLTFEAASANGGTGRGSLGYWYSVGQYSRFSLNVGGGGYDVRLRYASLQNATRSVLVDGAKVATLALPPTGAWNAWRTVDIPLALTSGTRTIEFQLTASDAGGINIDNVTILSTGGAGTTVPPTTAPPTTAPPTTAPPTTAPPTTVTTAPPIGGCRESFETGDGGWASWWGGTVTRVASQAATGTSALQLDGSPATARATVDPAPCGAVVGVAFSARTSAGRASLYLKRVISATGVSSVFGPYPVSTSWQTISVPAALGSLSMIGLEIYPASGASVWIDDVTLLGTAPPTTSTTTTTTATTTTMPAGGCPNDSFEGGVGGWGPWWNGTVAVTSGGATGASSLRLSGGPGTAQKVLDPSTCGGTYGVEFSARVGSGTGSLYVKLVDQTTGSSRLFGPFAVTAAWSKVSVRASLTARTIVALEAYSSAGALDIDDVTLLPS